MSDHYYRAFGLVLSSPEPLPSLEPAALSSEQPNMADVIIRRESIQAQSTIETVGDAMVGLFGDGLYLRIDEVGQFVVTADAVVVDPEDRATPEEVQIYLLGSVMGCLLYLRDRLPFHCNALEIGGKAFLFCGTSGAGKSTLAAFMEDRGHRLLTDDMCALNVNGPVPIAFPGIPRLKLWDDALETLGRQAVPRTLLPWHDHKWELPIMRGSQAALAVGAIYHLRDDPDQSAFCIERTTGLNAINAILANVYRRRIGDLLGKGQAYLTSAVSLAQALPIYSVSREWSLERFERNALKIEEHVLAQLD